MGHASSIAYGINQNLNENKVVCLDGDGSLLMHMGSLGIIGQSNMKNFIHVIFAVLLTNLLVNQQIFMIKLTVTD